MKKCILFIGLIFLFGRIHSQEIDCSKVKDGVFKSVIDVGGVESVTLITREGNKQIEENKAEGVKMEFKVRWTSSCTYELSKPKVVKGEVPGVAENQVMYVKVTNVTKEFYSVEVTSNFFNEKMSFDFLIVNKDQR